MSFEKRICYFGYLFVLAINQSLICSTLLSLQILSSNRILSAPIEASPEVDGKLGYLGFVDMFDLVAYALKMSTQDQESGHHGIALHTWCQDIHKLSVKGRTFENHLVRDVIGMFVRSSVILSWLRLLIIQKDTESGYPPLIVLPSLDTISYRISLIITYLFDLDLSHYNPFCSIAPNSALPKLIFIFQKGIHRVAVLDPETYAIRSIISQSTIIKFLANNIKSLGKIRSIPVVDLNLGQKVLVCSRYHFTIANPSNTTHYNTMQSILCTPVIDSDLYLYIYILIFTLESDCIYQHGGSGYSRVLSNAPKSRICNCGGGQTRNTCG